jgi:hypothetical protein
VSRRDFEMIARVIRTLGEFHAFERETIAEHFADALAETNPRFDRERFLRAGEAGMD